GVGGEGVRKRVLRRVLPAAAGGDGAGGRGEGGVARWGAQGARRAGGPPGAGPPPSGGGGRGGTRPPCPRRGPPSPAGRRAQEALRDLGRTIREDHVTHERLKAVEREPDWFDRRTWSELAKAKLLGVAVPEAHGGAGLGLIELCLLLEQVGRTVAPIPLFST